MAKRRQTTTGSLYLRRRFQRILREGGVEALIEEYEKRGSEKVEIAGISWPKYYRLASWCFSRRGRDDRKPDGFSQDILGRRAGPQP